MERFELSWALHPVVDQTTALPFETTQSISKILHWVIFIFFQCRIYFLVEVRIFANPVRTTSITEFYCDMLFRANNTQGIKAIYASTSTFFTECTNCLQFYVLKNHLERGNAYLTTKRSPKAWCYLAGNLIRDQAAICSLRGSAFKFNYLDLRSQASTHKICNISNTSKLIHPHVSKGY